MRKNGLALGIEIGGTKLQVGIGQAGKLSALTRDTVEVTAGGAGIRRALRGLVSEVLAKTGCDLAEITKIGIGFGGPVDSRRGVILKSFQITGWDNYPLRAWAEDTWQKPVIIQNDAKTAGLAEALYGAGKGRARIFYLTIGSGIGGGWVVNRQIDEGQGLGATEIGHTWVPHPVTGKPAELEAVCSGWAIGTRGQGAAEDETSLMLELAGSQTQINAEVVYAAAEQGDEPALRILDETCQTLGLALGNIVSLLHPERIIIGGGVSLMGPLFWDRLRREVQARSLAEFSDHTEVVPAALGEGVVVIGALALEKERTSE